MNLPTVKEMVAVISEHFGLTKAQAAQAKLTPTHPAGLRDTLAGQAMQGLLSRKSYSLEVIAEDAYSAADAMLKERLK